MTKITTDQIIETVEKMTVQDLNELVKTLEDKFGVSAAAPVAVAAAGGEAGTTADTVDIVLTSAGSKKINVLKVVREVTGLGLKEAKDLVESAPKSLKESVKKEEAEEIKKKIESAGGKVEFK